MFSFHTGISTDGGSNMCAELEGCVAYLQRENINVVFQACASHRLNLVCKEAFKTDILAELFKNLNEFGVSMKDSGKRMEKWFEIVEDLHKNNKDDINLKKRPLTAGGIRWSGKFVVLNGIVKNETLYIAMFKSIYCVCNHPDLRPKKKEILEKLVKNLEYWCDYDKIVLAFVTHDILTVLEKTTRNLQKSALPLSDMIDQISRLYQGISIYLDDAKQHALISKAIEFANNVTARIYADNDITLQKGFFANIFCKRNITVFIREFIDTIQIQLQSRFFEEFKTNELFYKDIHFLNPSSFQTYIPNENNLRVLCQQAGIEHSDTLSQFEKLRDQFLNFVENNNEYEKSKQNEKIDWLIKFLYQNNNRTTFKNILELYKYIFSLPCTEVKAERDFSQLRLLKTDKRSVLSDKLLENDMLILLNKDLLSDIDFKDIVNKLAGTSNKLKLLLMHDDD